MTDMQSMMLSVCFGATVGWMIAGLSIIIREGIAVLKEKRRRKKENKEE